MQTRKQTKQTKARATQKAAKPGHPIHQQARTDERFVETMLPILEGCPGIMPRLLKRLGIRTNRAAVNERVLEAVMGIEPTDEEGNLQIEVHPKHLEAKGRVISVRDLITHAAGGSDPKLVAALIRKMGFHEPPLPRYYSYAIDGSDIREDGEHPLETFTRLAASRTDKVVAAAIECHDIALARQLFGQLKDRLVWHEVPRRSRGELASVAWHGGPLTNIEGVIETQLQSTIERERRAGIEAEINELRRSL